MISLTSTRSALGEGLFNVFDWQLYRSTSDERLAFFLFFGGTGPEDFWGKVLKTNGESYMDLTFEEHSIIAEILIYSIEVYDDHEYQIYSSWYFNGYEMDEPEFYTHIFNLVLGYEVIPYRPHILWRYRLGENFDSTDDVLWEFINSYEFNLTN
jgi:hypothetical protein